MKYISSQHYLDFEIIEKKMEELKNVKSVVIPFSYVGFIDGEEYAAQVDGHHTLAAARELGIDVEFDVNEDSEGLTGETLLDARYIDGDWYNVETSNPFENEFDLVW